ncbi:DUF6241 domain-containing protein [Desulfosporosinus sp. PR]|uniref:DUF6241 domain-containing protein n=1 Tax=Candidatus Desulfosporosinus nitrosoreducens TaxID=3401928 RepID=UPI0027FC1E88|nr:DUF6241 domain-containing protein [Desulfosporosinus sp. PR]MDQ7094348.1 DUF6241 domain-containing protein [Desulfosporosinus sp. PR]
MKKQLKKVLSFVQSFAGTACILVLICFTTAAVALGASPGGAGNTLPLGDVNVEHQVIVEMNKMANNYIIADGIGDKEPITHKKITELKARIVGQNTVNRGMLVDILDRWEVGDFYGIDQDRNSLLTMIDGTVDTGINAADIVSDDKLPAWHRGVRPITDLNVVIQQKEQQRKADLDEYNAQHGTNIPFEPTTQKAP